jgi:hypothetical protein
MAMGSGISLGRPEQKHAGWVCLIESDAAVHFHEKEWIGLDTVR